MPTRELELVEGVSTTDTPENHFTAAVKFADGYDTIQARIREDGDYELGYRFDYEGYAENVEGAQPFYIDKRHLEDFIVLLQRVKDSL